MLPAKKVNSTELSGHCEHLESKSIKVFWLNFSLNFSLQSGQPLAPAAWRFSLGV